MSGARCLPNNQCINNRSNKAQTMWQFLIGTIYQLQLMSDIAIKVIEMFYRISQSLQFHQKSLFWSQTPRGPDRADNRTLSVQSLHLRPHYLLRRILFTAQLCFAKFVRLLGLDFKKRGLGALRNHSGEYSSASPRVSPCACQHTEIQQVRKSNRNCNYNSFKLCKPTRP